MSVKKKKVAKKTVVKKKLSFGSYGPQKFKKKPEEGGHQGPHKKGKK